MPLSTVPRIHSKSRRQQRESAAGTAYSAAEPHPRRGREVRMVARREQLRSCAAPLVQRCEQGVGEKLRHHAEDREEDVCTAVFRTAMRQCENAQFCIVKYCAESVR